MTTMTTKTTNTATTNTNTNTTIKTNTNDDAPPPPRLLLEKEEKEEESAVEVERWQRRSIKRLRAAIEHNEEARRVAALRRSFAPRVEAAARAAFAAARAKAEAARAAAKAGLVLQALDDELREATRVELLLPGDDDYAERHPDGLCGVCVALAMRIATRAADVAGGAERVADDAELIAAGAEAFFSSAAQAADHAAVDA